MLTFISLLLSFLGCLKSGNPTTLEGDIFFKFVCSNCSSTNQETIERMKLTWWEKCQVPGVLEWQEGVSDLSMDLQKAL